MPFSALFTPFSAKAMVSAAVTAAMATTRRTA